jgi:hypothetical protein
VPAGPVKRRHVLLVVDHPGDLRGAHVVFVGENTARPDAGRDRVGADADLLALEVLRHLDAGVGPHDETAVMKPSHDEDRQRDERCAERACDHVGGGRHLADVELDVANHAAKRTDDGHHFDEIRVDALQPDLA